MSILDLEENVCKVDTKYLRTKTIGGQYHWRWNKGTKHWITPMIDIRISKTYFKNGLYTSMFVGDIYFSYDNRSKKLTYSLRNIYGLCDHSYKFYHDLNPGTATIKICKNAWDQIITMLNISDKNNDIVKVTYECEEVETLERITNDIINIINNLKLETKINNFKITSL